VASDLARPLADQRSTPSLLPPATTKHDDTRRGGAPWLDTAHRIPQGESLTQYDVLCANNEGGLVEEFLTSNQGDDA
jgi:hypothetical protein